jgi:aspartyl protease
VTDPSRSPGWRRCWSPPQSSLRARCRSGNRCGGFPFDHYHGLIFLTARINGSEPLAFAFDSGASLTTINESRAAALKLTLRHAQHVTGADGGEGSIRVAFAKGVAFTLFQPRQVFKKDGRDVRLHVKRGEQQLQYRFRMRRRI